MFSTIGKFILNIVENNMSITNNFIWDTLIFMVIGAIAYTIAYAKVGGMASSLGFNSGLMSLVHWATRIFLFWLIGSIVMFVVGVIRWLLSLAWWVYLIIGCTIALILGIIVITKLIRRRKHNAF